MIKIRTDLAVEAREIIEESGNSSEILGVKTVNKQLDDCVVTKVDVLDEQGSQIMNKGIGTYVTLESKLMKYDDDESRNQIINYLADELKDNVLIASLIIFSSRQSILVFKIFI